MLSSYRQSPYCSPRSSSQMIVYHASKSIAKASEDELESRKFRRQRCYKQDQYFSSSVQPHGNSPLLISGLCLEEPVNLSKSRVIQLASGHSAFLSGSVSIRMAFTSISAGVLPPTTHNINSILKYLLYVLSSMSCAC